MLDWVFGCDICQEVCPVNRKASVTTEPAFQRKELSRVDLLELLDLSEEGFREKFRGTTILRAKRVGLKRNACVALGNLKDPAAIPALSRSLVEEEPLVRSHAAWALGQIGGQEAKRVLLKAMSSETDADVLAEISDALRGLEAASLDSA
jgi:epoxyqueuosine reductase